MAAVIRIGTRASRLALAQSTQVAKWLRSKNPGVRFQLVTVTSQGDRDRSFGLFKKGQVGVFTKALEKKLLSGGIDLAVHSLKDLPTTLPPRLTIGAYPKRSSVCDVLVSSRKWSLKSLPMGAVVGTGSPRRKRQLLKLRPDLKMLDLRGNLDTRVNKALKRDGMDAVVVAEAGLIRIHKYQRYARRLEPSIFLPAVGQGALAIEIRKNDKHTLGLVKRLNDAATETAVTAERAFLKALRGGCRVPVGVYTKLKRDRISIACAVYSVKNNSVVEGQVSVSRSNRVLAAQKLAQKMLRMGAGSFLREARSS